MLTLVLLALFPACSKDPGKPTPAPEAPASTPAPAPEAEPEPANAEPAPSFPKTAQGFYDSCRERVEGPSTEGECTSDADCVASGCSKEMCVSKTTASAGLMSPCERAPCFQVLDTCSCQQGQCSWTVKTELPEPLRVLIESTGAK